jgi:hypothetical protein
MMIIIKDFSVIVITITTMFVLLIFWLVGIMGRLGHSKITKTASFSGLSFSPGPEITIS